MASAYCTESDLYAFGVQRGALANPSRPIFEVSAEANAFQLNQHGFSLDDAVFFRVEATGGAMPAPIVEGDTYYAIPVNDFTFQVAALPGGAAIDLTTDGARLTVAAPLPIDEAIEWASHIVEDMTPANAVPFEEPYPEIIVATAAELAAGKLLARTGSASDTMSKTIDAAQKRLTRWARGVPLRGENARNPTNLAASSRSLQASRASAWDKYGGL